MNKFIVVQAALRNLFLLLWFSKLIEGVYIPWVDEDPFAELSKSIEVDTQGKLPPVLSPGDINDENRSLNKKNAIPSYVVDYCPLVHLYSEERYWPSDIQDYVKHFSIVDGEGTVVVKGSNDKPLSLADLKKSYTYQKQKNGKPRHISSEDVFMQSLDDFDADPKWLLGTRPEYGTGHIEKAPAVLIIMDKGNGWVDAFWFYFYPFNLGAMIMGYGPWGNHVGDWEHSLVRFYRGKPMYLWLSAHSGGTAYRFEAVEKIKRLRRVDGKLTPDAIHRPLIFSARGTHANYASVGQHPHDVPFFFMPLSDFTDRGPLWDPSSNYLAYTFDGETATAVGDREANLGMGWLSYLGAWGDKEIPYADPRQHWCPAQRRYITGPKGPLLKHLSRTSLCPSFKSWNFWHGCPARRFIKHGNGLTAEKGDLIGDNCGVLLYRIRPRWLRSIMRFLMWRGVTCFVMEFFTG